MDLDYRAFDADHHYYEAEDAFIRHVDRRMQERCMSWAEVSGRKRLMVGGRLNRFIPNPTFDPVAKPGSLDNFFRGKNPEGKDIRELFGQLEPISPAYRDRNARLKQLDQQGIEGAFFFPTLGVGMQESLRHDPEAASAAFTGFNRWLEEDWGYAFEDRIFTAPYISLMDADWAEKELESLLERGARLISMVPGPVPVGDGSMSVADPVFDGFWARISEARIPVAFHAGDSGYRKFTHEAWGGSREFRAFAFNPIITCLSPEPIHDTFAALICHGLFDRHPGVRVASIECGSNWVIDLARRFKKAYGQMPTAFKRDPMETLREHCSVAPYYEDDIQALREIIGTESILFGSDFPHAEGLADPMSFLSELDGFSPEEVRMVMRENSYSLLDRS
ncbi:MAG: amidohydrolase family protein [Myxococcota bacterium]